MTDKIPTTSRTASTAVGAFLRTASKPQKMWFMTQGEPTCLTLAVMQDGGLKNVFYPSLRGIAMGQPVESPKLAVEKAAKVKADIIATEPMEAVDEAALGIDDEALDLADLFNEDLVRIDAVCHIATMYEGSAAEPLERILEDLLSYDKCAAFEDLPFLRRLTTPEKAKPTSDGDQDDAEDLDDAVDGDDERPSSDELVDDALMLLRDNGAMGFLIEATVPEISDVRGGAYSVHYGIRRTEIIYASTYRQACLKALDWGRAQIAAMQADPKRQRTEAA